MTSHDMERLIAIEFFGWEETETPYLFVRQGEQRVDVRNTFTKDITFAWLIAEKMKATWADFAISNEGGKWNVFWGFGGASWQDISADTVEMALSLACLQSKEVELSADIDEPIIMSS